jgi:hypothetical protein
MFLPNGKYATAAGSTIELSGKFSGATCVDFDWFEEPEACIDCEVNPYPEDFGDGEWRLVWRCDYCGGGSARLFQFSSKEKHGEFQPDRS